MAPTCVLVVGDLMLDRSWVMSARIGETVQAHRHVVPTKRFAPSANDIRLGGAGATASAIAQDDSFNVHLLASYNPKDTGWFEDLGLRKAPGNSRDITFHSADHLGEPQTTLKFRVYQRNPPDPPRLRFRFDQDPIVPNAAAGPVSLPKSLSSHNFDALVIADFQKGMISPALIDELCEQYGQIEWFVDSKNVSLFDSRNTEACPLTHVQGTLLLNRTEFLRFREHFCNGDSSTSGHALFRGDGGQKLLLSMMKEVLEKLEQGGFASWRLVVKLDRDGAAAAWGTSYVIGVPEPIDDAAGICAGDFFLAGWIRKALDPFNPEPSEEEKYESCLEEAIRSGTAWVCASERTFWTSEAYKDQKTDIARPSDLTRREIEAETVKVSAGNIAEEIERLKNKLQYPSILTASELSPTLDLNLARLSKRGDFLTISPYFAEEIRSFMDRLADHVRHGERRRPMNCVIWAPPGSGKSYLARQMEKELEAQNLRVVFREINVSSYTSRRDVIEALARASEEHTRGSLILIDELSSEIEGKAFGVIPALLGPLWDGVVVWEGRDHPFDRPVTFLLADSRLDISRPNGVAHSTKIQCADDLLGYIRTELLDLKGPDFVSRINGPVLTFPNDRAADTEEKKACLQLDRMYLIGSLVHRYHRDVVQMHRGVLDLLVVKEKLTARQLEYLIGFLRPTDGELRNEDLVGVPVAVWKNLGMDKPRLANMNEAIVQLRV